MSVEVQDLVVPGDTIFDGLRERVQAALELWSRAWLVDATFQAAVQATVVVATANAADSLPEQPFELVQSSAPGRLWIRTAPADRSMLARAVMGFEVSLDEHVIDPWVADVSNRAWVTRNDAVCAALLKGPVCLGPEGRAARLSPRLFRFGSGTVQISCDALGLYLLVDADLSRTAAPPSDTTAVSLLNAVRLSEAIRSECVHLEVLLGTVDLPLPQILDLRCGDVLRVTRRLEERLSVHCAGNPIALAALGQSFGRTAAQLFASHQPHQRTQA
jgi:Type III flagellar switch regulator (C-ring) FliN C-term